MSPLGGDLLGAATLGGGTFATTVAGTVTVSDTGSVGLVLSEPLLVEGTLTISDGP